MRGPRLGRAGLYLPAQLGYLAAGARVTLLPYSASKDRSGGAASGSAATDMGLGPISDIEFRKSGRPDREHRLNGGSTKEDGNS